MSNCPAILLLAAHSCDDGDSERQSLLFPDEVFVLTGCLFRARPDASGRLRPKVKLAIVIAALAATPALAQTAQSVRANDPAIVACEAVAREQAGRPKQYVRVGADLHGHTTVVDYRALGRRGRWELRQVQCTFQLDSNTAQWKFDETKPADVMKCEATLDAATRVARRLGPQLRRCRAILKADARRQAVRDRAINELTSNQQYPIVRTDTALVAR